MPMADSAESDAFFASAEEPESVASARLRLAEFVETHRSLRIACVTSGGTTVPLERHTVRFIDNFSTGGRGAASAEKLLEGGYAVIFIHRKTSLYPFSRKLPRGPKLLDALSGSAAAEVTAAEVRSLQAAAADAYSAHARRLLAIGFESVHEYLFLLREAALALHPIGTSAMLYLAAAVSDFYIPSSALSEHKIQSAGSDTAGSDTAGSTTAGGLSLTLHGGPKLLGEVKRLWAPRAFLVSFKLETNPAILKAKAKTSSHTLDPFGPHMSHSAMLPILPHSTCTGSLFLNSTLTTLKAANAISRYGVDVVVANLLESYKRRAMLVSAKGGEAPPLLKVRGDEITEIHVEGVSCVEIALRDRDPGDPTFEDPTGEATPADTTAASAYRAAAELEDELIAQLVRLHDAC